MGAWGYGGPILDAGPCARLVRARTRLVTRVQYRVLATFSWLSRRSLGDRLFARLARRLVGAYLYSVKLEVNTACNLTCPMCYVARTGIQLPLPAIERLLDQLRGCGMRVEILGGEPLLRNDLAAILVRAKRHARSPLVSVYTNGMFATPERARELRAAGLDAAIVTLVSHRASAHDEFVEHAGAFAATLAGIRNFREAGVATYTFTPLHRRNYAEHREIHAFVTGSLGVHALFYQYVPQRAQDPLSIDPATWAELKRWVLYQASPGHAAFVRDFFMLTGSACSGGNFVLTVKADGSVQPCPFLSDIPLGNIHQQDIWTIYRNRYRGTRLHELKRTPEECLGCGYESVCAGGCRAGNMELFGSYAVRDHRCLGPHHSPFHREEVGDRLPTFF